jgi:hypothetical protein
LTKINLEKIIKKNKNRVWKHYNNPRCFKEKNNKAKFSISLISKKENRKKIILEKIIKKTMWGNTFAIHIVI